MGVDDQEICQNLLRSVAELLLGQTKKCLVSASCPFHCLKHLDQDWLSVEQQRLFLIFLMWNGIQMLTLVPAVKSSAHTLILT